VDGKPLIVLDTHALIWWADAGSKLSLKARQATRVHARRRELVASTISIFEIVTLHRRGRLEFSTPVGDWLPDLRKLPELTIHPVTDEVAERAGGLGDVFPGDPDDRIIAATALILRVPLITQDGALRDVPNLPTLW
jgi:PIN domain nuclease of toxin-antitoxin system